MPRDDRDENGIEIETGSWPEYRKFVVAQLRATAATIDGIRETLAEQKIRMASLDAHLFNVINGTIERRIESLETTRTWTKGIGAVLAFIWSILLILLGKFAHF